MKTPTQIYGDMIARKAFIQGYACAVANLLRERDNPVYAEGLLESIGNSESKFKDAGVAKEDIKVLKKYKLLQP